MSILEILTLSNSDLAKLFHTKRVNHQGIKNLAMMVADKNIIKASSSLMNLLFILVSKKDGSPRCCDDHVKLNSVTLMNCRPLPNITDCLDSIGLVRYTRQRKLLTK